MDNKTGIISPLKKEYAPSETGASLASSLTNANMSRFPGVIRALTPYRERDGSYRTGLDENALYIQAMEKHQTP